MNGRYLHLWICLFVLVATSVSAEVKLPAVVGDHMVLQRRQENPIWGWDTAGTEVVVRVGAVTVKATANEAGRWEVKLPAMEAGGPHQISIAGTNEVVVKDVLVGEVWLCSGQSNMEWTVNRSLNKDAEIAAANHPRIRHLKIPHRPSDKPEEHVDTKGWEICSPSSAGDFTAVGYYFARKLQSELSVPVGLIGSNWGGTRIEPWTTPAGFAGVPALKDISDKIDSYPEKRKNGSINHQSPLALYNGMIHPLVPYGIKGALWYQGESNNGEGMLYFEKKKALIKGWRKLWKRGDLPFYFVQLAPYRYGNRDPKHLAGIWDAQSATLSIPHTGMAATMDIGNVRDIHPKNKQDVGARLARWALAKNYGRVGLVYSGPMYKSMQVDGNKVVVTFEYVAGGLVSRDGKALSHFQLAGEDKKFIDAKAEIKDGKVVVSAEGLEAPVAVRFAYHHEAQPNLSNREGLPASPFRSDDW